ncbi:MAG: SAM-dependent methyltransferase, partial [Phenylobacterium sp.]
LKLLSDLRQMGETSVLADRHPRGLTRTLLARAVEIYGERFSGDDGRVAATFEIVTLTGWAPARD